MNIITHYYSIVYFSVLFGKLFFEFLKVLKYIVYIDIGGGTFSKAGKVQFLIYLSI